MNDKPVIAEEMLNAPASKVWKAITDKNEMKKWYFDLKEFRAEAGFKFEFTGGPSPDVQYVHECEVTEAIPGKKLAHSWSYKGYEGMSFVTWELNAHGAKTLLRLTHTGLGTFGSNPDFASGNFEEGWNSIIHTSLKKYIEG